MRLRSKQWIDGHLGRFLAFFNVILVRGIGLILRRQHKLNVAPQHILVIKILGLGSIMMAGNSIKSLRKKYPSAKIILITSPEIRKGAETLNLFDDIWVVKDSSPFVLVFSVLKNLFRSWACRRKWIFDMEVYSVTTSLFSAWTMGINRFGFYLNEVRFRNYLNTHPVVFNQFISVSRNYEELVKAAGVEEIETFKIEVPIKATDTVKFIAINNTCSELGGHLRKMNDETLVQICRYIAIEKKIPIALTGTLQDQKDIDQLIRNPLLADLGENLQNHAGRYQLDEFYSFLKNSCQALITIDSAPFHMATRLDVPTLSLWGPTNPHQRFEFNGPPHLFHYLQAHCSPCIHHSQNPPCGGNNFCMNALSVKSIKESIDKLIAYDQ